MLHLLVHSFSHQTLLTPSVTEAGDFAPCPRQAPGGVSRDRCVKRAPPHSERHVGSTAWPVVSSIGHDPGNQISEQELSPATAVSGSKAGRDRNSRQGEEPMQDCPRPQWP